MSSIEADELERRFQYERRRVNLIWEGTQAIIAASVTGVTLYASVLLAFRGNGEAPFLLLSNAFFMVLGMYFRSRIDGGFRKSDSGEHSK